MAILIFPLAAWTRMKAESLVQTYAGRSRAQTAPWKGAASSVSVRLEGKAGPVWAAVMGFLQSLQNKTSVSSSAQTPLCSSSAAH